MQSNQPLTATAIETAQDGLYVWICENRIRIPWEKCSEKPATATERERLKAELSPGGYGIHWPLIDEDLSIGSLLKDQK